MRARRVSRLPVKGRHLPPSAVKDFDGNPPPKRPLIDEWLAARLLGGWHPKAVAAASDGAISLRTAYRWRRTLLRLEVVQIDNREATFAVRRGEAPARISLWREVPR